MSFAVVTTTLYLDDSLESQRLEILAKEKGDLALIRRASSLPDELRHIHPEGTLPLLLDKHLILHGSHLIDAYFEERYPAPPLLPSTPLARSKVRFLADRIKSWYALVGPRNEEARFQLDEFAEALDPKATWFAGDMFTMIDVAIAPLLAIAPALQYVTLPRTPIDTYRTRLLNHPSVAEVIAPLARSPFGALTGPYVQHTVH